MSIRLFFKSSLPAIAMLAVGVRFVMGRSWQATLWFFAVGLVVSGILFVVVGKIMHREE